MKSSFTTEELAQAIKTFKSSMSKCEKALPKLKEGSPQRKWVNKQLEAYYIAISLIEKLSGDEQQLKKRYTEQELNNAAKTLEQLIAKCEILPAKFRDGSPQKTLALKRLKAFYIALDAILSLLTFTPIQKAVTD